MLRGSRVFARTSWSISSISLQDIHHSEFIVSMSMSCMRKLFIRVRSRFQESRVAKDREQPSLVFFFSSTKSLPILSSAYAAATATATRTLTAPLTATLSATDAALLLSLAVMPVLVRFSLITTSRCYCSSMTD
jgi:hypothetical protein